METLFPVIFLGRAAENNVGPGGRVHDMRTMWSPYDQSCNLGGPARKKVWPEDRVLDMRDMWSSYDQSCKLGGAARKRAAAEQAGLARAKQNMYEKRGRRAGCSG